MFESSDLNSEIKIIDFGLSSKLRPHMHTKVGTPVYVAPEVLSGDYN